MSSGHSAQFTHFAPLLPASIALFYIISIVRKWEQALAGRMSAYKTRSIKEMEVPLPSDTNDIKPQENSTFNSHLISAAIPIAHHYSTSLRFYELGRTETVSTSTCVVQIIIIVAEFMVDYVRYSDPRRGDLFALGAFWGGLALRSQVSMLRSGLTGIASSICIAILAVSSILPEYPTVNQDLSGALALKTDKLNEADFVAARRVRPRTTTVHIHLFSVSLLLVYLVHDYSTLSSTLLYRFSWMGSSSHWLIAFGLLLLREGADKWQRTFRHEQTLTQHMGVFVSQAYAGTPDFVRCVLMALSVIGPWFLIFFASSFLTSCLGFRALIFGRPRSTPKFLDGGAFGGFIYQILVLIQLLLRRGRLGKHKPGGTFHLMMTLITAFGQTITGLVIVTVGLYGLQIFDNTKKKKGCRV